ncbi:XRE family transcriptional regulator [Candidatus Williamhamiltonella defendens]|uniref:XRE family transcriptional regulator n=1 Tax=Candidatus Williamhamiltonella defendens TaxID=138072 RepID=UPI00036F6915|nr:XRE family transcriptional regulator [Candidatus Hamiltonella defensa]CED78967.1 Putative phage repressor [Candidatus Hamiltonella defensa (Bemisia tabaci)]
MSNTNLKILNEEVESLIKNTAKNLAHLMKIRKVDAATLSKMTGLGIATVNSIRRGEANPTLSTLSALSNFFEVSLAELTGNDLKTQNFAPKNVKAIPLIKLNEIDNYFFNGEFVDTYTTEVYSNEKNLFSVSIDSDSQSPFFPRGTVCIFEKGKQPSDGDIVLVKIHEHTPCFRRIFIEDIHFLFSPVILERDISPSIYSEYKIFGILLKAIKIY